MNKYERALDLLIEWVTDCDWGYDNIPDEYERYKEDIKDMDHYKGLKYILLKECEEYENC